MISESVEFDWSDDILISCLRNIEQSDVYVLLIGSSYGSTIPGSDTSITRAEYRHAVALGKPIYVLCQSDTWVLYTNKALKDERIKLSEFLDEIGANMQRNIYRYSSAETAFPYIKEQLTILLRRGINSLNSSNYGIMDATNKKYAHFFWTIIKHSQLHSSKFDRILAVFADTLETGMIMNDKQMPVVTLSKVTGATLFRINTEGTMLEQVGATGDTERDLRFRVEDDTSYVSVVYGSKTMFLTDPFQRGMQKQFIMCTPLANDFVLAIHFSVEREYAASDTTVILDRLLAKNETLFSTLQIFLKGGVQHVKQTKIPEKT